MSAKPEIDTAVLRRIYGATTQGTWVVEETGGTYDKEKCRILLEHTPPEQRTFGYGCDSRFICDLNDGEYHEYADHAEQTANAAFISTAYNVFLALLDEIDRLRAKWE